MTSKVRILLVGFAALLTVAVAVTIATDRGDVSASEEVAASDPHAGQDHTPGEHAEQSRSDDGAELPASVTDWCAGHSVPESECTKCHPELIASFKEKGDWCPPHELPESHCRICNPEIVFPQEEAIAAQASATDQDVPTPSSFSTITDWCSEHSVPESECTKCHPELIASFKEEGDWCPPHELPESHCRICNPEIVFPQEELLAQQSMELSKNEIEVSLFFRPNTEICATDGAIIQFASAETARRTGITARAIRQADRTNHIQAPAEVVFDEGTANVVTSSVDALVSRWLVSPGDVVNEDEVLAILTSPDIAELQARLLSTGADYEVHQRELERHNELLTRELISQSDFDRIAAIAKRAKAEFTSARGLLISAGMSEADISRILKDDQISNEFALRSPADGIVVERIAPLGKLQEAGSAFAMLADPQSMWIEAQLTEEQLRFVSTGQDLTFTSDGRSLDRVGARVIWVSRQLDPHTRTGTVRAEVIDPSHSLQAGELGVATILEEVPGEVVLVPRDAVQWEGCCNVVFVKENDERYRPRKVEIARSEGPYYQVISGLRAGEQVVVDGAFLLKTELKKSSIGAGCCGIEAAG